MKLLMIALLFGLPNPAQGNQPALQQLTGESLRTVVVGTSMSYLDQSGKKGTVALFLDNGEYRFLSSEPWSTRAPYRVTGQSVCIMTQPKRSCFKVYRDREKTFIREAAGPLRRVSFSKLDKSKR